MKKKKKKKFKVMEDGKLSGGTRRKQWGSIDGCIGRTAALAPLPQ